MERVTNEQLSLWIDYRFLDDQTKDICRDLLEARAERDKAIAMVKEMREVIKNVKADFQPSYHDCTDDGFAQCSWCDAKDILEKSKEYVK